MPYEAIQHPLLLLPSCSSGSPGRKASNSTPTNAVRHLELLLSMVSGVNMVSGHDLSTKALPSLLERQYQRFVVRSRPGWKVRPPGLAQYIRIPKYSYAIWIWNRAMTGLQVKGGRCESWRTQPARGACRGGLACIEMHTCLWGVCCPLRPPRRDSAKAYVCLVTHLCATPCAACSAGLLMCVARDSGARCCELPSPGVP